MHQHCLDADCTVHAIQWPMELQRHNPRNYPSCGRKVGPELHEKVPAKTVLPLSKPIGRQRKPLCKTIGRPFTRPWKGPLQDHWKKTDNSASYKHSINLGFSTQHYTSIHTIMASTNTTPQWEFHKFSFDTPNQAEE